jgi:hypothetical protein
MAPREPLLNLPEEAFYLMGLQQRLVEAFCCPSPLSVSTPLPLTFA